MAQELNGRRVAVLATDGVEESEYVRTDISHAGGSWVDEVVHADHGLVTSRKPDDLPEFNWKVIEEFAQGRSS